MNSIGFLEIVSSNDQYNRIHHFIEYLKLIRSRGIKIHRSSCQFMQPFEKVETNINDSLFEVCVSLSKYMTWTLIGYFTFLVIFIFRVKFETHDWLFANASIGKSQLYDFLLIRIAQQEPSLHQGQEAVQ